MVTILEKIKEASSETYKLQGQRVWVNVEKDFFYVKSNIYVI